jgi:hypothetical protein
LIKGNFKLEWLVEVRIQGAFLDRCFLLLQSFACFVVSWRNEQE